VLSIAVGALALFMIVPILVITPMSFNSGPYLEFPPEGYSLRWYGAFFQQPEWRESLVMSVEVALMATLFSLLLGVPAAFALVRGRFPGKPIAMGLVTLPILFPVIVSAVALYYLFARLHLVGSPVGLAVAHTVLALPVVVLPMVAALRRFDERLEWQALSLGASQITTFFTVTAPILASTLVTVSLFAFITSFDEVIFAIFLSSGSTITLPKRIWEGLRFEIEPTVAVVSTFLIALTGAILLVALVVERTVSRRLRMGRTP
jgi:ABC-type spermidine/putrescine transport system permease subunit II